MKQLLKKTFRPFLKRGVRSKSEGQAFLELTLILPVIFVLVLGIIAIGFALSYKMKTEAVAREATRVIAKSTGSGSVQIGLARARQVAEQYGFDLDRLQVEIRSAEDQDSPVRGGRVNVTVTYQYKMFNFTEIKIVGNHSEAIECWRKRSNETSGGTCVEPAEQ